MYLLDTLNFFWQAYFRLELLSRGRGGGRKAAVATAPTTIVTIVEKAIYQVPPLCSMFILSFNSSQQASGVSALTDEELSRVPGT